MATKEVFEEAVAKIKDERYRKIVKGVANEKKAFGKTLMVVQEMCDSGGNSSLFGDGDDFDYEAMDLTYEEMYPEESTEEDEDFSPSSALYEYQDAIEKLSKTHKGEILILDDMGQG